MKMAKVAEALVLHREVLTNDFPGREFLLAGYDIKLNVVLLDT